MFFGKRDKDVRITDAQYKNLVNSMSKKERREFDRKQEQLRREREEDRLLGWWEFEDEMDDMESRESKGRWKEREMATILVDYENVSGTQGLKGVEYLNEGDHLVIFYSFACMKIAAEYMDPIRESGCEFTIYKLKTTRKNALDFYIATEAGRLSALGNNQIALITKDKGFDSISDFFSVNEALKSTRLVVSESIEHGLEKLSDPGDIERRKAIRQKMQTVDLEVEYGRIQEKNAVKAKITQLLKDTEYMPMADNIIRFFSNNKEETSKKIYTGSLHEFGLKDGVAIYRILKDVV